MYVVYDIVRIMHDFMINLFFVPLQSWKIVADLQVCFQLDTLGISALPNWHFCEML